MPPKLNKKEIMKIMNNEMKKKSPTKYTKTTPGGSYVVNRKKGEILSSVAKQEGEKPGELPAI